MDSPETGTQAGHPRRWLILGILNLSLVLIVAGVSSLNLALPSIQRALGATGAQLVWVNASYALVFAAFLLPAGALGDRFGRRGALQVGLVIFLAASLLAMGSDTAGQVIFWRCLMGVGAALTMPATLSILTAVFPPEERARAIAIWSGFAGAGGAIGLLAGGLLLENFWWGSVFLLGGAADAGAVPGIEEVTMTRPVGHEVVPLPEGNRYLGFILARGETAVMVEQRLRQAHLRLDIVIEPVAD